MTACHTGAVPNVCNTAFTILSNVVHSCVPKPVPRVESNPVIAVPAPQEAASVLEIVTKYSIRTSCLRSKRTERSSKNDSIEEISEIRSVHTINKLMDIGTVYHI
jgi:hypothetical protein